VLTDRYCNFTFQSPSTVGDRPALPHHADPPVGRSPRRGTLQDVTCDSDGKISSWDGVSKPAGASPVPPHGAVHPGIFHRRVPGDPGDLHNPFGDTNAVHIRLTDGGYEVKTWCTATR